MSARGRVGAAVLSGALLALTFPVVVPGVAIAPMDPGGALEVLAWFALVPLLVVVGEASSAWRAAATAWVTGTVFGLAVTLWLPGGIVRYGAGSMSRALALWLVACGVLHAGCWALVLGGAWYLRRHAGFKWRHLAILWTAVEPLREWALRGLGWGNLGYSQAHWPALAQLGSIGGVYLVGAVIVLVNGLLAEVVEAVRAGRGVPWRLVGATSAVVVVVAAFGSWRLQVASAEISRAERVKVAAVQLNALGGKGGVPGRARLEKLLAATVAADEAGAELVVWPETAYPTRVPAQLADFSGMPGWPEKRLRQASVLVGARTFQSRPTERGVLLMGNSTFLVKSDYSVARRHVKELLVPFGEYRLFAWSSTAIAGAGEDLRGQRVERGDGEVLEVVRAKDGVEDRLRVGVLICSDAVGPAEARAYAGDGADLLVHPTNDTWAGFTGLPYQFLAMAQMRAIESGRAIVRAAYAGVSTLILPTGELSGTALGLGPVDGAGSPNWPLEAETLVVDAPRLKGQTLYVRIGDLFVHLCVALSVAWAAVPWWRLRRAAAAAA